MSPIMDLGCGTGAWLQRLHEAGYSELWGIDRDSRAFDAADIGHFIQGDLDSIDQALELPDGMFHLITITEVIEHVANPEQLVRLACRLLAHRGWLLITSPNIYSLRARMRFLIRGAVPFFEQSASHALVQLDHIH